jgi:glycosyltransferase involved in cell wall biosynthesis
MSSPPEICIIGRCNFHEGIGNLTAALAELLRQAFDVAIFPVNPRLPKVQHVYLPSGTKVPLCHNPGEAKATIFCDVLWNGVADHNYKHVPATGLRLAYFVFDSDVLPAEWVDILNHHFDAGLVPSWHLADVARSSGVTIPVNCLPLALNLSSLLGQPLLPLRRDKTVFGALSAFHPRKGHDVLIRAFAQAFGARKDVALQIRSNIVFGHAKDHLDQLVRCLDADQIQLTHIDTPVEKRNSFLQDLDVFVSASFGESYNSGVREALALGKPAVLSAVGGHNDLAGVPGVTLVPAPIRKPAFYPEIDGRFFGHQRLPLVEDFAQALVDMAAKIRAGAWDATMADRRRKAAEYSFEHQLYTYIAAFNPAEGQFRRSVPIECFSSAYGRTVRQTLGSHGGSFTGKSRRIVVGHDAGYFSVFNSFLSHLVWDLNDPSIRFVLPDWDVTRMKAFRRQDRFVSFCYGRPEDGNIWLKLYEPLFGLDAAQMNDREFLYDHSRHVDYQFNEKREPLLTYRHAYRLYRSPDFQRWRQQYHRVYRDHVHLVPELRGELDSAREKMFDGRHMLGAHIRHPSHAIEQPDAVMATGQHYIDRVRDEVKRLGLRESSADWGVFLATDQAKILALFRKNFGENVFAFDDVRRTTLDEDALFERADPGLAQKEGFQVQHLVAQNPDKWTSRMAWEVVRDAMFLAECRTLFHVTSNISTAVSYMNPAVELEYCG